MVKQVRNICPLAINPDLDRALEASFESSVVTWQLGWDIYDSYDQLPVQSLSC